MKFFVAFIVCIYIYGFYMFSLEKFIILMYDLYVRVCLGLRGNWILLSFDEIDFDFIT
jgi:hypothetical protein